jgi:hypothetical protein
MRLRKAVDFEIVVEDTILLSVNDFAKNMEIVHAPPEARVPSTDGLLIAIAAPTFTIPGPGHTPHRPQPAPNKVAPRMRLPVTGRVAQFPMLDSFAASPKIA